MGIVEVGCCGIHLKTQLNTGGYSESGWLIIHKLKCVLLPYKGTTQRSNHFTL